MSLDQAVIGLHQVPAGSESSVDRRSATRSPRVDEAASPAARAFYVRVMKTLSEAHVDFLVGGTYAFTPYTGIARSTKDFDIFVRSEDATRALDTLADSGLRVEMTFPHWLAKVFCDADFVDIIFNSGNGVTPVDEEWFLHASDSTVFGVDVKLAPAEEMLWSKAFVMERERYDGADIIHILRSRAERLDWDRLLARFGDRWRVLLVNLVLFGFIYPAERARIPGRVMRTLIARLESEVDNDAQSDKVCHGTVVSREQYLPDTHSWGYADGREMPYGNMTAEQIAAWTVAIGH
jgi:hypothetical protein